MARTKQLREAHQLRALFDIEWIDALEGRGNWLNTEYIDRMIVMELMTDFRKQADVLIDEIIKPISEDN